MNEFQVICCVCLQPPRLFTRGMLLSLRGESANKEISKVQKRALNVTNKRKREERRRIGALARPTSRLRPLFPGITTGCLTACLACIVACNAATSDWVAGTFNVPVGGVSSSVLRSILLGTSAPV